MQTDQPQWKRTMHNDLERRSDTIHWPKGFNPKDADIFSHTETQIHASAEKIWQRLVDIANWPTWYPDAKDIHVEDKKTSLDADSLFHWKTFGYGLESKVNEFVPNERIGWFAYAPGAEPNFYHTWLIIPQEDSCLVITEEVGFGEQAAYMKQADEGVLHRGHDMWLATLKWASEDLSSNS